jgi:hypothetical protein
MIFKLLFLAFILNASTVHSKSNTSEILSSPDFYKHFKGNINKTIFFHLNLIKSGITLRGTYYYDNVGQSIILKGEIKQDSMFVLTEYVDGIANGYFNGEFLKDGKITGFWQDLKQEKQYPFELHEDYTNSIEFKCLILSDTSHLLNKKGSPYCMFSATICYPENYKDKIILKQLKQSFKKLIFDKNAVSEDPMVNLAAKKQDFFKTYKNLLKDNQYSEDLSYTYMWETSAFTDILYNDDNLLSFGMDYYDFSGGAHGLSGSSYVSYDLKTGKEITEKDLFISGFEPRLKDLLIKNIMKAKDYKTKEQMQNEGFEIESIKPNGNFYLDKKGIYYFFNPYEIAAYAFGPTNVYIKYDEIKEIIKPNCPVNGFLK